MRRCTSIESRTRLEETVHCLVGLEDGDCTGVHGVESLEDVEYGFELSGPYGNWQEVVRGEMGAIEGIMGGDFELDGDLNKLMEYQDAATTFVETYAEIETEFV